MKTRTSVLLVDDDPDDRQLFINALHEANEDIDCITARDGQEGLEALSLMGTSLPGLIVLDLRMPKFGGEKCLDTIRSDSRYDTVPIVIYTTSRSTIESKNLLSKGAIHFMSKPINEDEVYYQVTLMMEEYFHSHTD